MQQVLINTNLLVLVLYEGKIITEMVQLSPMHKLCINMLQLNLWRVNNVIVYSIGSAPVDLMLNQISADGMISVSWTPPPAPPSNGYRMTVNSEDFSGGIDTMLSSQTTSLPFGMHTIRVQSLSIHFPGRNAAMDITVLGKRDRAI